MKKGCIFSWKYPPQHVFEIHFFVSVQGAAKCFYMVLFAVCKNYQKERKIWPFYVQFFMFPQDHQKSSSPGRGVILKIHPGIEERLVKFAVYILWRFINRFIKIAETTHSFFTCAVQIRHSSIYINDLYQWPTFRATVKS